MKLIPTIFVVDTIEPMVGPVIPLALSRRQLLGWSRRRHVDLVLTERLVEHAERGPRVRMQPVRTSAPRQGLGHAGHRHPAGQHARPPGAPVSAARQAKRRGGRNTSGGRMDALPPPPPARLSHCGRTAGTSPRYSGTQRV